MGIRCGTHVVRDPQKQSGAVPRAILPSLNDTELVRFCVTQTISLWHLFVGLIFQVPYFCASIHAGFSNRT